MFLKKASIVSVLALAVGVSAAGSVSAAPAAKVSAVKLSSVSYIVNGELASFDSVVEKGRTLVPIRAFSAKLGAKLSIDKKVIRAVLNGNTVELQANSNIIKVNGAAHTMTLPVKSINNVTFVELRSFVNALGANFETDGKGAAWIDASLLTDVDQVQWANATTLIASTDSDAGRVDYTIDARTGKYSKLLDSPDASALAVAPNGASAAYTNAAGEVFVINLTSKVSKKISADTVIKTELVWSADSKSIYIIAGEKSTIINKLDVASGELTKVLEDASEYKSNLSVSADGIVFTYTVTKAGKVTVDATKPVESDDVVIDTKGTEPQIYRFDSSAAEAKSVALTESADDKVFVKTAADGSAAYYVSTSADDAAVSTLAKVGSDKAVSTVFNRADIYQAVETDGKWVLLTEGASGSLAVYEVNTASGAASQTNTLPENVSEIVVKSGAPLAIVKDERVFVSIDGHWKPTTR